MANRHSQKTGIRRTRQQERKILDLLKTREISESRADQIRSSIPRMSFDNAQQVIYILTVQYGRKIGF